MLKVQIPPDIARAVFDSLGSICQDGSLDDWQRLTKLVASIEPQDCHVADLGFVLAIEPADLPRIYFALRAGLCACQAVRNELDIARTVRQQ